MEYKSYKYRWIILFIFVVYTSANQFQWIQYSIITDIVMKFYNVPNDAVNWLSMIFMLVYIPCIFPASWYLEKKGLRKTLLLGAFGNMVAAWVKCASISPDLFWVTFVGQFIASVAQIFILGIPPRLAAVWFSAEQVSTACALGVFGTQLGVALGFLFPPMLVPNSDDPDEIAVGLMWMFYGMAVICTVFFIIGIFFFKEKPDTPPSAAAEESSNQENADTYITGIKKLMLNLGYVLLLISYGINVGVFYAMSTLLNAVFLAYFHDESANENAGRIGLVIVLAGMIGSVACGYILDRTAKFKWVTVCVYALSFLFMLIYTFILELQLLSLVFILAGALGFFMTGYLPIGFEFASELTFPEPEGTSSGLLNASAQVFGIIFILFGDKLMELINDRAVNLLLSAALLLGCGLTILIKEDLKRQKTKETKFEGHTNPQVVE